MKKFNFVNRVIIQAIIAMILSEWFWSNSYMYDEIALYIIWGGFGLDIGLLIGRKISNFIKRHFKYEK